jgi:hypothetical protein
MATQTFKYKPNFLLVLLVLLSAANVFYVGMLIMNTIIGWANLGQVGYFILVLAIQFVIAPRLFLWSIEATDTGIKIRTLFINQVFLFKDLQAKERFYGLSFRLEKRPFFLRYVWALKFIDGYEQLKLIVIKS